MTVETHQEDLNEPENQLSSEEREQVSKKLTALETDFRDMLSRLDPFVEKHLKELAGPHLEIMRNSREQALQYLLDSDPKLREASLQIVARICIGDQLLSSQLESLATSDPASEVRDGAVRAIGNCYIQTKDRRIGQFLASIVFDSQIIDGIRLTAYMSLIRVHGIMSFHGQGPLVPLSLKEIDWEFARTYYDGHGVQ